MLFLSSLRQLKYYCFFFIVLITISSCRKDKEFVIKEKKIITKEEIESLKNIERTSLIWRNKKNFTTLRKYLNAKEQYLMYSKSKIEDIRFLSEYYFYLSFTSKNKEERIYALEKGYANSKLILENTSLEYKNKTRKHIQDYKIINLLNDKEINGLYWYITNNVFLRKETGTTILYKDDIEVALKYYYKISNIKDKIFAEGIYLKNLPKIGGKDEKKAEEIFNKLKENKKLLLIIKNITLNQNPKGENILLNSIKF